MVDVDSAVRQFVADVWNGSRLEAGLVTVSAEKSPNVPSALVTRKTHTVPAARLGVLKTSASPAAEMLVGVIA